MPLNQVLTGWKYTNQDIEGRFKEGILWCDGTTGQVSWQINDASTAWHGHFEETEHQLKASFDALVDTREDGRPKLKSTVLYKTTTTGLWIGHDYRFRTVMMMPLVRFTWSPLQDSWQWISQFNPNDGWVMVNDGPMAPAA